MRTFRVVCTKTPRSTIVDFAAADNAANSLITHNNLLKLRQYQTPDSESLLPPLMLTEDNDGKIAIDFEKPGRASGAQYKLLNETEPRILASYNKFKHSGKNSTLEITKENLAIAYDSINPNDITPRSSTEETFRENLRESQRRQQTAAMKANYNKTKPSITKRFYTTNGD